MVLSRLLQNAKLAEMPRCASLNRSRKRSAREDTRCRVLICGRNTPNTSLTKFQQELGRSMIRWTLRNPILTAKKNHQCVLARKRPWKRRVGRANVTRGIQGIQGLRAVSWLAYKDLIYSVSRANHGAERRGPQRRGSLLLWSFARVEKKKGRANTLTGIWADEKRREGNGSSEATCFPTSRYIPQS